MNIRVLGFGIAKDIFGGSSTEIILNEPFTVSNLKSALEEKYKQLVQLSSYMIAVNSSYSNDDQIVTFTDEVALIPPVSGG